MLNTFKNSTVKKDELVDKVHALKKQPLVETNAIDLCVENDGRNK